MSATSHYCQEAEGGAEWLPGPVASCPNHSKNRNTQGVKWGRKIRRDMDRETGVVGIDRGTHIHGT